MNITIRISIVLSLSLILLVQSAFLPIPLSLIFMIMIFCLWICLKRQIILPRKWIFILTGFALCSIYFNYKSFVGIDAGVAVLSTFLFAKALETKSKRDLIILFNFALFVVASSFLFSQSFVMAVGVILCLFSCLIGLYRIQTSDFEQYQQQTQALKQDAKHVGRFIILAMPFFVLLFLFFPRLPPLWHIPIPDHKAVTGISDSMSPGDIAQLSQSSALAFRIIGDMKQLPPRSELYWRALVLDEYDGQKWSRSLINQQPIKWNSSQLKEFQKGWDYQYLAADSSVRWVMGLEKSIPLERRYYNQNDWSIVPYRLIQRIQPIPLRWMGENIDNMPLHKELLQQINTKTQSNNDPKAQKLAQSLWNQSQHNPQQYIQEVLKWYKDHNFAYTLTPGLLGQHRVDEFLFQSKQGFCEHYASSFAMLMRYVGIPARVVTGYQGGQLAPDGQSWEVRQYDAHAWTEVFIDQKWQRIDPIAMIAPQRIDGGMQNLISQDIGILGEESQWNIQRYTILTQLRILSDYASYQWQSKVVGYNSKSQRSWLSKLGLNSSYATILILFLSSVAIIVIYFLWIFFKVYQASSPFDRAISSLDKSLESGLKIKSSETFRQWMLRLSGKIDPSEQKVFFDAISIYEKSVYSNDGITEYDVKKFQYLLKYCSCVLKSNGKSLF